MIVSAVLSGFATLFYLIGCIGNSKDEDTIAVSKVFSVFLQNLIVTYFSFEGYSMGHR
jgi:hypothetical protein